VVAEWHNIIIMPTDYYIHYTLYIILYGVRTLRAFLTSAAQCRQSEIISCADRNIVFFSARKACIHYRAAAVWCSRTNQIIHLLLKTRAWPSRPIIAGSYCCCDMTRPIIDSWYGRRDCGDSAAAEFKITMKCDFFFFKNIQFIKPARQSDYNITNNNKKNVYA